MYLFVFHLGQKCLRGNVGLGLVFRGIKYRSLARGYHYVEFSGHKKVLSVKTKYIPT